LFIKISSRDLRKIPVYFKNRVMYCEVPETAKEKETGLQGRDILFEHQGMLFDTQGRYQPLFTMRNVIFDLEAIFIGNDYTIKDIVPMRKMDGSTGYTSPLRIPVRYVIEVNKGWSRRNGIELGDKVRL
jgi:uncharacterized membrane protein (UPF0127 family)